MYKKLILLMVMIVFLSSCVATQDELKKTQSNVYYLQTTTTRINQRLSALEKRVGNLENSYKTLEKKETSIKATQLLKFNEVFAELKTIKNQIADLNNLPKPQSNNNEGSTEVTQEAIKDLYSKLGDIEKEVSALKANMSGPVNVTQVPVKNDKYYYKEAYNIFASGKYSEAAKKFLAFIQNFNKSSLLPNAYYWLGECYFKMKMYDKAIINYDNVIVKFPKHQKVPAALLKEGIAFLKIGEKDGAKLIFKRIIQDYPKSIQAKYARNYLRRLK